ncbi:MAG: thioesterase domain-containing protein, partial [Candidatus Binatia bacterium]
ELHIGGAGLARGYLNRPDLTAEKFISNPFSDDPGSHLYKTGDLARYLPDGNIEFLGRIDHQVKVRGFRIELGEIEAVLGQHPEIRETVVMAREDTPGNKRLVAYVVPRQEQAPTINELRSFLKQKLPDYMVPSVFVPLDALPLTANGKVNRRALPPPDQTRPELEKTFVAPKDAVELQLMRIWEEILEVKPIGMRDNFFDLGGHSLLAVRLFAQIEKTTGKKLPLATLFQSPTVEQLAGILRQEGCSTHWSSLVAIQSSGSKPPFFCVHAHDGNVLFYRDLALCLGLDQPVYGLQAQGLDGENTFHTRLEDMAAQHIKEMRTLQPEGPYFLGGFCFGGKLAFEMAQQLDADGQKVALLALFDTYGPGYPKRVPVPMTRLLRKKISRHLGDLLKLGFKEKLTYVLARVADRARTGKMKIKRRIWKVAYKFYLSLSVGHPLPRALRNIAEVNLQAARDYIPQAYSGRLTLFRASRQPAGCYPDPHLGWGRLAARGLEIYEVPIEHYSMMRSPILAEQLKACLERAQATESNKQTQTSSASLDFTSQITSLS